MGVAIKNDAEIGSVLLVTEAALNPSDVVTPALFAQMIGKTKDAVRGMVEKEKVPVIEMKDPDNPSSRAEYWVYLPAWNAGMKKAFESRPPEIRDGWLRWIGF